MASTVAGTFPDRGTAERVVERLQEAGIPADDISLILRPAEEVTDTVVEGQGSPAVGGAAAGGVLGAAGGLVISLVALAIPGVGPVLAAGPIAAVLGGTAIGAATGGLLGAITGLGVPESYATTYVTHLERGHALVTVRASAATAVRAREILVESGASNLYAPPAQVAQIL